MIKSLELSNWKSFESATLFIDPLTILIGANASGKSNILDAFVFLKRISSGLSIQEAIEGTSTVDQLRGGASWVFNGSSKHFCIEVVFEKDEVDYCFSLKVESEGSSIFVGEESLQVCESKEMLYWVDSSEGKGNIIVFAKGENVIKSLICKSSIPVFRQLEAVTDLSPDAASAIKSLAGYLGDLFVLDPVPSRMRGYSQTSKSLREDASNIAGVLASFPEDEKNLVEETITEYAKALPEKELMRVYAITAGAFGTDTMLMCEEGWESANTSIVDASGMSDGILRYLAIATALLTRPENSLLIIEEADNGLQPSRAKSLLNMLTALGTERKIDVLITTHNPAILDAAGNRMIPFIFVVHRDSKTGFSLITPLDTLDALPKIVASGTLGEISTNKSIENALKMKVST